MSQVSTISDLIRNLPNLSLAIKAALINMLPGLSLDKLNHFQELLHQTYAKLVESQKKYQQDLIVIQKIQLAPVLKKVEQTDQQQENNHLNSLLNNI